MSISLRHAFDSGIADIPANATAGDVLPSHWDAEHLLTQATGKVLGRVTAGTGATEELTVAQLLALIGTANLKAAILESLGWDDVVTTVDDVTITVGSKEITLPLLESS